MASRMAQFRTERDAEIQELQRALAESQAAAQQGGSAGSQDAELEGGCRLGAALAGCFPRCTVSPQAFSRDETLLGGLVASVLGFRVLDHLGFDTCWC